MSPTSGEMSVAAESTMEHAVDGGKNPPEEDEKNPARRRTRREATTSASTSIQKARK
jgi:hypothetical protein